MPGKPKPTRTVNPIHFADLDPHRFDDLVRQLVYDFRAWAEIQAIGRSGSDDGSDTRAYEIVRAETTGDLQDEEDEGPPLSTRLWVIQSKRRRSFSSRDAKQVVDEIKLSPSEKPYGLIVAAPVDMSLATRRSFATAARQAGFEEFCLWGRGELEDQLYMPKNDHLLFAYFGISLQVRRRSARTELRAELTLKRQLARVLGGVDSEHHENVLLRTADNSRYPFVGERKHFLKERPWWYCLFVEHWPPNQLAFETHRFPAFINAATGEWDAIFDYDMLDENYTDLWGIEPHRGTDEWQREWTEKRLERERYMTFYEELPEENQAHLSTIGLIPYNRILAVDELGDRVNNGPHLIVERNAEGRFFDPSPFVPLIRKFGTRYRHPTPAYKDKQIEKFPKVFPKLTEAECDALQTERSRRAQEKFDELKKKGRT